MAIRYSSEALTAVAANCYFRTRIDTNESCPIFDYQNSGTIYHPSDSILLDYRLLPSKESILTEVTIEGEYLD